MKIGLPGTCAIALLLVAHAATAQQSPVDGYFAAFDRARVTLDRDADKYPPAKRSELDALHDRLGRELEATMRRLVGPLAAPAGFAGDGQMNRELWRGVGSDRLDGIRFSTGPTAGPWSSLVVTSDEILASWVARYRAQVQDGPDASFASGDLSAQVINDDGWMQSFAFLAIDKPKGVDALAVFVGEGGNGFLIWPPNLLSLYLRKGHRVYLADLPLAVKFSAIAACDALHAEDREKLKVSPADFDEHARYNKCWEERGRAEPAFAAAIKQAQAFVDELAALP